MRSTHPRHAWSAFGSVGAGEEPAEGGLCVSASSGAPGFSPGAPKRAPRARAVAPPRETARSDQCSGEGGTREKMNDRRELQTAETAAQSRIKRAVTTRNEKHTALVAILQQLRAHIQAAADANVENGASIIESAGVAVRK